MNSNSSFIHYHTSAT